MRYIYNLFLNLERDRAVQQREEALVAREDSVRTRENASESALRDVSEERARIAREITKMDLLRVISSIIFYP